MLLCYVCSLAVVALLYFMTGTVDYAPLWNTGDHIMRLFVIVDTAASTVPFALSVTYHTFMPHISGLHTYRRLLKTDVFGVWFTTTFGSLSGIYVAVYCLPPLLRHGYLVMYMLLSLVVLYYVVVVDCKRKRVLGLTVQFFFRSLVQLLRLTSFVTAPLTTFHYYVIVYVVSSVGALINTLHVPECWFPGRCDYVLNGHSMMHVAAFLSVALGKHAMLMDLTWLTDNPNCPVSH